MSATLDQELDMWKFPHVVILTPEQQAIQNKKNRYLETLRKAYHRTPDGKINAHATLVATAMRRDLYAAGEIDDLENHQIVEEAKRLAKRDMEAA
jgi:hypothetical protein